MKLIKYIFRVLGVTGGGLLLYISFYNYQNVNRISSLDSRVDVLKKDISKLHSNYEGIDVFLKEKFGDSYVFSSIYTKKVWANGTSGSGSFPKNAAPYINYLQNFILEHKLHTIYDFGCGDWQIMSCITIPSYIKYLGCDVAKSVIDRNIKLYEKDNIQFEYIPNTAYFSKYKGDLLIVKEVLQHWNTKDIQYFLKNILPNFKYAIICNIYDPNGKGNNKEIMTGQCSPLDLEVSPYNLKFQNSFTYEKIEPKGTLKVYLYINDKMKE